MSTGEHQISGSTTGTLLHYVRLVAGEAGVGRVIEQAGETRTAAEIADPVNWCSYTQAVALFDAAAAVTGDPDIGFRIGEETLRQHAGSELAALLRSLGSPGEILRNIALSAAKYSSVSRMEAVEIGDEHAVVTAKAIGVRRHKHLCRYSAGTMSQASVLFGLDPAVVVEETCEAEGDDRCTFRVTWDPSTHPELDPERHLNYLQDQLTAMTSRFESLQATATELASAEDIDTALAVITHRAGLAVRAPQFVLAVRIDTGRPRVHSIGLTVEEADALAVRLFAGEVTSGDNRLVVDVASVQGVYGKLMAIQPTGGAFFPQERQLLAAYAGHAAAALEGAAALETSRRRDRTARALLDLGRALADAQTPEETSERLATAIPDIVDCDAAAVFLWDEDTASMRLGAAAGLTPEDHALVGDLRIDPEQTLLLRRLLVERAPLWIRSDTPDAFVSMLLALTGKDAALVVPIMRGGAFLGVLSAAFDDAALAHRDDLVERLAGTAGQAAIALDNARLLAQVRHQALHDPITGLANIRLFTEKAKDVLRGASRAGHRSGLLFVDLDRFKAVNDAHGHASGDELLREIGRRLGASVRETDTVARIGGDEFAVVLGRLDSAEDAGVVAGKLERALDEPFELGTENLHITASIGVAIYPDDGLDLETLLRRADSAMYTAKAGGRHTSRRWTATSPR